MRDNVEGFVNNGGNVCFLSGNVCWWQVRFEKGYKIMVCYKVGGRNDEEKYRDSLDDPNNPIYDPSRVTTHWLSL
jgi:hypothetical protein